jgi:hypothetical protein
MPTPNQNHGTVASNVDTSSLSDAALVGQADAIANRLNKLNDKDEKLDLLEDYMRVRNELKLRSIEVEMPDIFSDKKNGSANKPQSIFVDEPKMSFKSNKANAFTSYAHFLSDEDGLEDIEPETPLGQLLFIAPNLLEFDVDAFIREGYPEPIETNSLEVVPKPSDVIADEITIIDPDAEMKKMAESHLDKETTEAYMKTIKQLDNSIVKETFTSIAHDNDVEAPEEDKDGNLAESDTILPIQEDAPLKEQFEPADDDNIPEVDTHKTSTQVTDNVVNIVLENLGTNSAEKESSAPIESNTDAKDEPVTESTPEQTANDNEEGTEPKSLDVLESGPEECVNSVEAPREEPIEQSVEESIKASAEEPIAELVKEPIKEPAEEPIEEADKEPTEASSKTVDVEETKAAVMGGCSSDTSAELPVTPEAPTLTPEASISEVTKEPKVEATVPQVLSVAAPIEPITESVKTVKTPALESPTIEPFNPNIDTDERINDLRQKVKLIQEKKRRRAAELASYLDL